MISWQSLKALFASGKTEVKDRPISASVLWSNSFSSKNLTRKFMMIFSFRSWESLAAFSHNRIRCSKYFVKKVRFPNIASLRLLIPSSTLRYGSCSIRLSRTLIIKLRIDNFVFFSKNFKTFTQKLAISLDQSTKLEKLIFSVRISCKMFD